MALNYSNLLAPKTNTYSKLLTPSVSLANPLSNPAQSALSSKIEPAWKTTLANVQANSPAIKPVAGPVNPARPNQNQTALPTTAVKKVTQADGSTVEYHAPAKVPSSGQTSNVAVTQPIKQEGLVQTPQTPTTPPKAPQTNYGGLVSQLQTASTDTSAVDRANEGLLKLRQGYNTAVGNIENTPIPLNFQQGRAQVLGRQFASQEAAQQSALTNALTARGQTIGGLGTAAGLAAPQQVPYSNQYIDPTTGQPIGGSSGGTGVNGSVQDAVSNIAQKVSSGLMGYDEGVQALSAYGQGGVNALQQALGPQFDVVNSNASAQARTASTVQTGTTGGQLTKSADSAEQALGKLEQDFAKLNTLQTGGIPLTNSIMNWIGQQFGQGALSAYQTTLADARAQLQGVLTASGGATPTGAESMALTYLPDNMTPIQFKEKLEAARALVKQKVAAFTSSSPTQSNATNSLYSF